MRRLAAPTPTLALAILTTLVVPNLLACGREDPRVALQIRTLAPTPACWTDPGITTTASVSEAYAQMLAATRQMAAFRLSWDAQMANLLLWPVRRDPTAVSWSVGQGAALSAGGDTVSIPSGLSIEGVLLARGSDWALLHMVGRIPFAGTIRTVVADIDATPELLRVDFGGRTLWSTDLVLSDGDFAIGCDPATGASFWSGRVVRDGALVREAVCGPGLVPQLPSPEGGFAPSADLLCAQAVDRALAGL